MRVPNAGPETRGLHHGSQRTGGSAGPAGELSHVLLGHAECEENTTIIGGLRHFDRVRLVDDLAREVLEKIPETVRRGFCHVVSSPSRPPSSPSRWCSRPSTRRTSPRCPSWS